MYSTLNDLKNSVSKEEYNELLNSIGEVIVKEVEKLLIEITPEIGQRIIDRLIEKESNKKNSI